MNANKTQTTKLPAPIFAFLRVFPPRLRGEVTPRPLVIQFHREPQLPLSARRRDIAETAARHRRRRIPEARRIRHPERLRAKLQTEPLPDREVAKHAAVHIE